MFVLPMTRPFAATRRSLLLPAMSQAFAGIETGEETRTPPMDVHESDGAYTVVFDVPGAAREDLKVTIEGRRVVLCSDAAAENAPRSEGAAGDEANTKAKPADKLLYRERSGKAFKRTVVLPAEVDQANSQARFDNGVLTLTLAKKMPASATRLTIA